jgi:uncharacterized protein YndB with AHSA1/START domain
MMQTLFQREVLIDAPLDHVWQLVATESGLRQWWGNTISLEAKEGGRCEEWRLERNRSSHWQGVVTLYTPPYQLAMTLRADEAQRDWPDLTTISIALEATGEQTRVSVTQRAFASTSVIGTADQVLPLEQPAKPLRSPMAQLEQAPPGSLPMPMQQLATGHIEPDYRLLAREQADQLEVWWQSRLTSLAAASAQRHMDVSYESRQ